jgi:hypothetical protein
VGKPSLRHQLRLIIENFLMGLKCANIMLLARQKRIITTKIGPRKARNIERLNIEIISIIKAMIWALKLNIIRN